MADFLDDELLELAGDGDSEEEDVKPQILSSSPAAPRSPMASSPQKRSRAPPKRSRKKARRDDDSSEEGEESETVSDDGDSYDISDSETRSRRSSISSAGDDDDLNAPIYPLEGKYKDQADKERLLAMSELDREAVLGERANKIEKMNIDRQLQNLLKTRKREDAKAEGRRTSKRTKSAPKKSEEATKRGKLDELKRTREERKAMGGVRGQYGDEDVSRKLLDQDDDGDFVEDVYIPEEREIAVNDINRARIGRTGLAKLSDYPGFEDMIQDCFVKVALQNDGKGLNVYRLCQVKGITQGKAYQLIGQSRKKTDHLLCYHGKAERSWPMDLLSDKPFSEDEFRRWKASLQADRMPIPSLSVVNRKAKDIRDLDSKVLNSHELEQMLKKRNAGKTDAVKLALERGKLRRDRDEALGRNDTETYERAVRELQELEDKHRPRPQGGEEETQMQRMSRINAENRRRNMEEIRRAEIAEKRQARDRALIAARGGEPVNAFSRVKTKVKFRHDTSGKGENEETEPKKDMTPAPDAAPANGVGVMNTIPIPKGRRFHGIDDVIASMDIEIEI